MKTSIKSFITGTGRDVVLLHGWGCNSTHLLPIAKELALNYRTHLLDLPGFGATPEPPSPWNSLQYAEEVQRYLDVHQIKNPILIAHSFGGRIALHLAAAGQTDTLILTGGAGLPPARGASLHLRSKVAHVAKLLLSAMPQNKHLERMIDTMRRRVGSADYRAASPVMRKTLVLAVNEDLGYLLPKIQARTLLIWGENDTATPIAHARAMHRSIRGSILRTIPGTGHFSFIEQRQTFLAHLAEFLKCS